MRLTDQQQAFAGSHEGGLLLAGPGTGKTITIAAKAASLISSGHFGGHEIVALTYTSAMAGRLSKEIERQLPERVACSFCEGSGNAGGLKCGECLGAGEVQASAPLVGTMHSIAARLIRGALRGEIAGGPEIRALGWIQDEKFGIAIPEDVDDLISAAHEHTKRRKVGKRALRAGLSISGDALADWPVEASARQELARRGLLSYDDLIVCLEAMATALPRRVPTPEDPPTIGELYPCLLVDEAQDLTPRHWKIIDLWRAGLVVAAGDDGQEIFGFLSRRSSQPDAPSFRDRVLENPSAVTRLGLNFRAGPDLCAFSSALRAAIQAEGFCAPLALESGTEDSDRVFWPSSFFHAEPTDEGGIEAAANAIGELVYDGFEPEEIVGLARSWKELEELAALLEEIGHPACLPNRSRDRWKTRAGRAFLALARHADDGLLDEIGARALLETLGVGSPFKVAERAAHTALSKGWTLARALDKDRDASLLTPDGWWQASGQALSLGDLLELSSQITGHAGPAILEAAEEACSRKGSGWPPSDWLLWLASPENASSVEFERGRIALTTIHGAKGLEWPAVVLLGACDGHFPGQRDKGEIGEGEAARALYVGATRARSALRVIIPTTLRGKPRNTARWLVAAGLDTTPAAVAGHGNGA